MAPANTEYKKSGSVEDESRLLARLDLIQQSYLKHKTTYPEHELVVSGEFNRWDTLWRETNWQHIPNKEKAD